MKCPFCNNEIDICPGTVICLCDNHKDIFVGITKSVIYLGFEGEEIQIDCPKQTTTLVRYLNRRRSAGTANITDLNGYSYNCSYNHLLTINHIIPVTPDNLKQQIAKLKSLIVFS